MSRLTTKNSSASNDLDLDDIVSAAEVDYRPLNVTVAKDVDGNPVKVSLLPFLVLSEEKQEEVTELIARDENGEATEKVSLLEVFRRWARAVATDEDQAELLINSVGDKTHVFKKVQEFWIERTQPGEAKPSQK